MRYKVKWRLGKEGPLSPELVETVDEAKKRVRDLIKEHGDRVTVEVWDEEENWQVVTPAGVADWSKF
jgi:hypothetical protein